MFFPFFFWRAQVQCRITRKPPSGDKSHFDGAGHIIIYSSCNFKATKTFHNDQLLFILLSFFFCSAPGKPANTRIADRTENTITIQWERPQLVNGILRNYKVSLLLTAKVFVLIALGLSHPMSIGGLLICGWELLAHYLV